MSTITWEVESVPINGTKTITATKYLLNQKLRLLNIQCQCSINAVSVSESGAAKRVKKNSLNGKKLKESKRALQFKQTSLNVSLCVSVSCDINHLVCMIEVVW